MYSWSKSMVLVYLETIYDRLLIRAHENHYQFVIFRNSIPAKFNKIYNMYRHVVGHTAYCLEFDPFTRGGNRLLICAPRCNLWTCRTDPDQSRFFKMKFLCPICLHFLPNLPNPRKLKTVQVSFCFQFYFSFHLVNLNLSFGIFKLYLWCLM